jgi:hypothetical protein
VCERALLPFERTCRRCRRDSISAL